MSASKKSLQNKSQHIPFYSSPSKILTEMLVSLHHEVKNCRFSWNLEIQASNGIDWHIDMNAHMHAKVTRTHKEIKPRQLYMMTHDAFFGIEDTGDVGTMRLGTHLAPNSLNQCQFDYFFCPEDRFQYGNESKMRKVMEQYRNWMNQSLEPSTLVKSSTAPDDDLLNTAYAMPKSPQDDLVIEIALHSAYEDDKFFYFILKTKQIAVEPAIGMGIQTPGTDTASLEGSLLTTDTPLPTPHSATPFSISSMQIPNSTQRSHSVGATPNGSTRTSSSHVFPPGQIDSLNRRVNNLESENAELRALTQILKQQNLEMQEDIKNFQKALLLLTEKKLEKHKLTYKEFQTISKQFAKTGRTAASIIHHVEALTLGTIKGLSPKKMHLIYNRFKQLLPCQDDERHSASSTNQATSQGSAQQQLLEVRKKARDLLQQFSSHSNRFVTDICTAWVYSTSLNQPEKSIEIFTNLLKDNQSSLHSPQRLAFVSFSRARLQNDAHLALKDYSDAIRHNPTFFPSYINRANLYHYKLASPEQALTDYSVAIQYDPSDYSVFYNRAILYFKAFDNPTLALKDFNRALELNPKHSHSYNNRALLYKTKLNDPIRALQSLDAAIKHDPQYFALWLNRGALMFEHMQAPEEALQSFSTAIRQNPTFADAYVDRGLVYASLERNDEALFDFTQALRLLPEHVVAQEMYKKMQEKVSIVKWERDDEGTTT